MSLSSSEQELQVHKEKHRSTAAEGGRGTLVKRSHPAKEDSGLTQAGGRPGTGRKPAALKADQ